MAVVNDFAQGVRVAKHLNFIALKEPFMVEQQGCGSFLLPPKAISDITTWLRL